LKNQIVIREMNIEDYEEALSLWQGVEGIGLSDSDNKNEISLFLDRNVGLSFVEEEAHKVIGTVLCGHDGRRGFLYHLSVDSLHRGKGIGRKLVDRCLIRLREEGIRKCHLFVFTNNQKGKKFWEYIGFKERSNLGIYSLDI